MHRLTVLFLAAALAACAQTPQSAGTNPVAPVAQAGGIYAPTWIMVPGNPNGEPVSMTFQIGHSSDGNTEARGASQKASATQTNPVGDKAIDAVKDVVSPVKAAAEKAVEAVTSPTK